MGPFQRVELGPPWSVQSADSPEPASNGSVYDLRLIRASAGARSESTQMLRVARDRSTISEKGKGDAYLALLPVLGLICRSPRCDH